MSVYYHDAACLATVLCSITLPVHERSGTCSDMRYRISHACVTHGGLRERRMDSTLVSSLSTAATVRRLACQNKCIIKPPFGDKSEGYTIRESFAEESHDTK